MKKLRLIFTFTFLMVVITSSAAVWRVNNRPNIDADFTNLIAAHNAASANDTLYLEGSSTSYGSTALSKPLTIIGSGYFLDENNETQSYMETSKLTNIVCYGAAAGTVIEGIDFQIIGNNTWCIQIWSNNIILRRNHFSATAPGTGTNSTAIRIESIADNITIEQNWIEVAASTVANATGIYANPYLSNSIIRNNIIYCENTARAIYIAQEDESASLTISNNVIMGNINTSHSSNYNNILLWGVYTAGTDDINSNNLCNATQYPVGNGNQQNVDMTTVFEDYTTYIDNGYILVTGSPAIGAGVGGDDCGAFGTNDPYVLSGMPAIPAIFDFEMTQSIGTSTLPVTIKAKSHQ